MTKNQFKSQFLLKPQKLKTLDHKLNLKPAAVLIPLVERKTEIFVVLTQRALHLRHHPGQVSFPGGRFEPSDIKLSQTAIRETEEETGIEPSNVEIFGQMGLYRTVSNYKVTPFLGFVDANYQLTVDENEVKEVFEVPWRFLLERTSHQIETITRRNQEHIVHFMPYEDKMIWGTTALILHDLISHFE